MGVAIIPESIITEISVSRRRAAGDASENLLPVKDIHLHSRQADLDSEANLDDGFRFHIIFRELLSCKRQQL